MAAFINAIHQRNIMTGTTKVSKGFEISFSEQYLLLSVRAWGFWDKEFAQKCCRMITKKICEIGPKYRNWSMLIDIEGLHLESPDVESLAEEPIEIAHEQAVKKIGILQTTSLPNQQLFPQDAPQNKIRIGTEKEKLWDWLAHDHDDQ